MSKGPLTMYDCFVDSSDSESEPYCEHIVNNSHRYHCRRTGRSGISGYPQDNNPSIVSSKSSQVDEFSRYLSGYRDTPYEYEYTAGYGNYSIITKRCDLFYRTHKGGVIDYITLSKGNQYGHKARVSGKVKRSGKYFLKLDIL